MEKTVTADSVLVILAENQAVPGAAEKMRSALIREAVENIPCKQAHGGMTLWEFKNTFAQREIVWLREAESRTTPVVREVNPCLGCDCWDGDAEGCTMPPEDKPFACTLESEADKLCGNCRWYAEFEGVCTNGESEYRADFRESGDTCPQWES